MLPLLPVVLPRPGPWAVQSERGPADGVFVMSKVAEFSSYIGLVVVIFALVLLAPRLTVSAWVGLLGSLRSRLHALRHWRPGTVVAEPEQIVVEVSVGDRRTSDPDEVLEQHGHLHLRELPGLVTEALEGHAVALAVAGLGLRLAGASVDALPGPAVFAGDLLLVLGAFLVMQRTIRDFPEEWLPRLAALARPHRVAAGREQQVRSRARHLVEMAVLAPAFGLLLAWPVEIGRAVARAQFTGPQDRVLVVWACELPWLVALVWFLARPLIPSPQRKPRGRHTAPVVSLRASHVVMDQERQAA